MRTIFRRAAFLILVCVVAAMLAHYFLWIRASKGRVTYAGSAIPAARIYIKRGGNVLVLLDAPSPAAYVVSIRDRRLGIPIRGFWLKTRFAVGMSQGTIQWIGAPSPSERESGVRIAGSEADFRDFENHSIHVSW